MKLKEKCPTCGEAKEMYYVPWCPRCEKPTSRLKPVWNWLKCMYHLEAIGHKGIKARLWEYCCENNIMKSNDSYMELDFYEEFDEDNEDLQVFEDKKGLKEVFDIKEKEALFWVSW